MKKLSLLLVMCAYYSMNAQMPVTDVATNGQLSMLNSTTASSYGKMAEQVVTAAKQLTQLEKTYETVKATAAKVEKVNEAVQSYNNVSKYISKQKEIIRNLETVTRYSKGSVSNTQIQNILTTTSGSLKKIEQFLQDSFFNLNDKERMDLINSENRKLELNLIRSRMYANSVK